MIASWAFGGNADWVREPLCIWGSLGVLISIAALLDRRAWADGWMRPIHWFWPFLAFNGFVILGTLNPSFRAISYEGDILYANTGGKPGWPSSALPALALRALWAFDAIWIACFNIALVIRQRRALRAVLLVLVVNAIVLSVFGTVQKLSRADGLFFDAVPSPQEYFFSSFVYHNHWGAFMVLLISASLGIIWRQARRIEARDFFHSPIFAGVVVIVLLAASVPLSGSRSCTLLVTMLLAGAFLDGMADVVRKRRFYNESIAPPILGAIAALVLVIAGTWFVASDTIIMRVEKTRDQVADMRTQGTVGARAVLYADTWRMAQAKPWFGWGMGSYPHVFTLFNTRESVDRLPVYYHDAHSDWLQAFAEHGIVGTALVGTCVLLPLLRMRRRHLRSAIPRYLLCGCALIGLYAWIEFPFGNFAVMLCWWLCFLTAIQYARIRDLREDSAKRNP
ncbi:MAG: O-antigen ligase family protein [Opitutus sp.]